MSYFLSLGLELEPACQGAKNKHHQWLVSSIKCQNYHGHIIIHMHMHMPGPTKHTITFHACLHVIKTLIMYPPELDFFTFVDKISSISFNFCLQYACPFSSYSCFVTHTESNLPLAASRTPPRHALIMCAYVQYV
jgi:hypothetical protein